MRRTFLILMVAAGAAFSVYADENISAPAQLMLPCAIQDVWAGLEGGYHFTLKGSAGHTLIIVHPDFWKKMSGELDFYIGTSHPARTPLVAGSEDERLLIKALENAVSTYVDPALDQKIADHRGLTQDEMSKSFKQDAVRRCLERLRKKQADKAQ